jgi:hypothetical protein
VHTIGVLGCSILCNESLVEAGRLTVKVEGTNINKKVKVVKQKNSNSNILIAIRRSMWLTG